MAKPTTRALPALLALGALLFASQAWAELHIVNQIGTTFSPSAITVAPGDTVRWVWSSGTHTVTSGTPCTPDGIYFDSPLSAAVPQFEWVVPMDVASVPYFCIPHCGMGMTGTITVVSGGEVVNFLITLDGYQEYPTPVESTAAAGSGTATLDLGTGLFSWEITFADLSSAQTAAHFHGPAGVCETAAPVITLPLGSPIVGSQVLTADQVEDVLAGLWYVNVHTDNFTGGEIRGRVAPIPLENPLPDIAQGEIEIDLQPVATGLTAPNWGVSAPGDDSRLFVVDQNGILWAVDLAARTKSVFLDVSARLVPLGIAGPGSFDERGFLGLAFHPDYQNNGLFYTFTSEPDTAEPDFSTMPPDVPPNCQSVILEWHVPDPANPASLPESTPRELLRIDKPQFNHNGGAMVFGPTDGLLYVSLGDGGNADDRDDGLALGVDAEGHGCGGNGQNIESILGKVIRIDPLGSDSENGQYGIPGDNPFVGIDGLDEIWALGFRNPWRMSFEVKENELYVSDVGQNYIEEVDIVTAGGNYGWNWKEGTFTFVFNGAQDAYVTTEPLDVPAGLTDPIAEYDHDDGVAVVGGFVFEGTTLPQLEGKFVFGEFARTFSNDGRLFYLEGAANGGAEILEFLYNGTGSFGY